MNQALPKWEIQGELILNCNCTVFCPCVVSLGVHYPTEGHCQAWLGVHIEKGFYDDVSLDSLNVGMVLDIPGRMSRGDWKVGYVYRRSCWRTCVSGPESYFSRGSWRYNSTLFDACQ